MQPTPAKPQAWSWDDVRVFLAAFRAKSLAGAGRVLALDATTVGRRLRALEAATATHLFHRALDGLTPTQAARGLFESAVALERQADILDRRIRGDDTRLEGQVRVTMSDTFARFLVRHIPVLRRTHPGIEIDLVVGDRAVDITRGEADLAVRFSPQGTRVPGLPAGDENVLVQKLGVMEVGVFAARSYLKRAGRPKSALDVDGHDLILPLSTDLPGADWFRAVEARGRVALRTDTLPSRLVATVAGLGLCALPAFLAHENSTLVHIAPPATVSTRDIWLLVTTDLRHVARITAVRDFLANLIADKRDHFAVPRASRRSAVKRNGG